MNFFYDIVNSWYQLCFCTYLTNFQTYYFFRSLKKSQNPPYGLPYLRPNNEIIFRVCWLGWSNFVPNIIKIAVKMDQCFFWVKIPDISKIAIKFFTEICKYLPQKMAKILVKNKLCSKAKNRFFADIWKPISKIHEKKWCLKFPQWLLHYSLTKNYPLKTIERGSKQCFLFARKQSHVESNWKQFYK